MKVRSHIIAYLALTSAFSQAYAQTPVSQAIKSSQTSSTSTQAHAHPGGWELGASFGYNRVNTGQPGQATGAGYALKDYDNLQWGVHGGYYWPVLNRLLLGVETGYQSFGDTKAIVTAISTEATSITAWNALLAARYYLLNRLAVFGKLGGAYTRIHLKSGAPTNTTETRYFFNPEWQLGLLFDLNQHMTASLGFDQLVGSPGAASLPQNPSVMGILMGLNWDMNSHGVIPISDFHPGGWELGATVGYDRVNTGQASRSTSSDFTYKDYDNVQWGLHGGYYWPVLKRLLLGIEAGYQSFGGAKRIDSEDSPATIFKTRSIEAWDALLAVRFYVLNHLALFGKLGGAYTSIDLNVSGDENGSEVRHFFNPEWQLGLLMDLGQHLNATLGFNRLSGSPGAGLNSAAGNPDVMGVLAGLNWDTNAHGVLSMTLPHAGGWELGASVGYDRVNTGQRGQARSEDTTYSHYGNTQWGVHGGYYWAILSRLLLGVETGYQSYGGADMSDIQTGGDDPSSTYYKTRSIQAWNALLAARFYVLNHLAVFGKLGGAYTSVSLKTSGTTVQTTTETRRFFNPEWQLGLLMDLGSHLNATLGFNYLMGRVGADTYVGHNPDVMGILAGLNWDINAQGQSPITISHAGGWELGSTIGYNRVDTGQDGQARSSDYNYAHYHNTQWGVHGGYYWPLFKRLLVGLETGYQSFGGAKMTNTTLTTYKTRSIEAWDTLLVARFYVLNHLALFGKFGGAYTWIDLQTSGGATATETRRFFNPEWQLGLLMDLGQHVNVTLGLNRLTGDPGTETATAGFATRNPDVMGVLAGFNVRF